jgi:hypothetical protein
MTDQVSTVVTVIGDSGAARISAVDTPYGGTLLAAHRGDSVDWVAASGIAGAEPIRMQGLVAVCTVNDNNAFACNGAPKCQAHADADSIVHLSDAIRRRL